MSYTKVEYSNASGTYCTTQNLKMPLYIPEFYIRKIILQQFHVDNNKGELGIGYDMIIDSELMIYISLADNFKCQLLHWYGTTVQ